MQAQSHVLQQVQHGTQEFASSVLEREEVRCRYQFMHGLSDNRV